MKTKSVRLWISVLTATCVTLDSPYLWADLMEESTEVQQYTNPDGSQSTVTTQATDTGLMGSSQTDIQTAKPDKNIKTQGEKASSGQNMGMIAGIAGAAFSGAMAAVTCSRTPPSPSCPAWIMGAIASALIAGMMGKAKGVSDTTVTDVTDPNNPTPVTPTPPPQLVETETAVNQAASQIGAIPDMKAGTLKFADGRTLKAEDLNNKAALAAAGFSSGEIAGFQDAMEKAMKEGEKAAAAGMDATKTGNSDDSVTSGGGGFKLGGDSAEASGKKGALNRDPAQVAGLSRDYNGNPIGVASENIFTLINRRYDYSAQKNNLAVPAIAKKK